MTGVKTFLYLFLSGMLIVSSFSHSRDQDHKKLFSEDPYNQVDALKTLQKTDDVTIYVRVMELAQFSKISFVSKEAEWALKLKVNTDVSDLKSQMQLVHIATSDEVSKSTRDAARLVFTRIGSIHIETQQELARIATSPEASETTRKLARDILGLWRSKVSWSTLVYRVVQKELLDLAVSNTVSDFTRNEAAYTIIAIGNSIDRPILRELFNIAIRDSHTVPSVGQYMAQGILSWILIHSIQMQRELVRLVTSDTAPKDAQSAAKKVLIAGKLSVEIQEELLYLATADKVSETARSAAKEILIGILSSDTNTQVEDYFAMKPRGPKTLTHLELLDVQNKLRYLATDAAVSKTVQSRAREMLLALHPSSSNSSEIQRSLVYDAVVSTTVSETVQSRAREILLGISSLHLEAQQFLAGIVVSNSFDDKQRAKAKDILINVKLDSSLQKELVFVATSFSVFSHKLLFSNDFFYDGEQAQIRAKGILVDMNTPIIEAQIELVYRATSDVVMKMTRATAKDILARMEAINLKAQKELLNRAKYYTLSVRFRAWNILSQLRFIHPEIARSMGISLKCRRAFGRLVPSFGVAQ